MAPLKVLDPFGVLKPERPLVPAKTSWHPPFFRPTVGPGVGPGSGGSHLRTVQHPIGPFLRPT